MLGRIRNYNETKGYGWIKIEHLLAAQFFHVTQWRHAEVPIAGQLVEFGLAPDHKGRIEAKNVILVSEPEAETAAVEVAQATEMSNTGVL